MFKKKVKKIRTKRQILNDSIRHIEIQYIKENYSKEYKDHLIDNLYKIFKNNELTTKSLKHIKDNIEFNSPTKTMYKQKFNYVHPEDKNSKKRKSEIRVIRI